MKLRFAVAPIMMAGVLSLAGCATASSPASSERAAGSRPLETLPGGADLKLVRQDLLATATDRFGSTLLAEARASPTHLIVKRFVGMAPPQPPGASGDWRVIPAAALLARRTGGWLVATGRGWRPANLEVGAELDRVVADPAFWSEPAYTPPCPDFGANLLLLEVQEKAETVRNSTCMRRAARLVEAALRA
jgi:hypothetical protein